jgi:hypothetical protein
LSFIESPISSTNTLKRKHNENSCLHPSLFLLEHSLFSFSLVHAKTSHVTQKHKGLRYHSMQQKLASETWGLPLAAIGQLGTKE